MCAVPCTNADGIYFGKLLQHRLLVGIKPCDAELSASLFQIFFIDITECINLAGLAFEVSAYMLS